MFSDYFDNAKREFELYRILNNGRIAVLTETEKKNIEIFMILDKLGYPMAQLGTYLYKEIIVELYSMIKDGDIASDIVRERLIRNLNDYNDEFYKQIAGKENIKLEDFHSYIVGAIEDIEELRVDRSLAHEIYGDEDITFGTAALCLAEFYLNKFSYNNTVKAVKVKKLSNMDNINGHKTIV